MELTHFNEAGHARMVDVSEKAASTPLVRATPSMIFDGVPTPMRYRVFSFGIWGSMVSMSSYMSSVGSPTARPPMA